VHPNTISAAANALILDVPILRVSVPTVIVNDDPLLENGSTLCKEKSLLYLLVWKPERTGNKADTFGTLLGSEIYSGLAR
jgi:hypothetical protein